jgi:hypothetical protein
VGVGAGPPTSADVGVGAGPVSSAAVGAGAGPGTSADVGAGAGSARTSPRTRRQRGHHRGGIGTAFQADCTPAVPLNVPPPPPKLVGLTTTMLRQIAANNNIGAGKTGIQQSRDVGLAFERWCLWAMNLLPRWTVPIYSMQREMKTGGLPKSVIPEQVKELSWLYILGSQPDQPQSIFVEVKAVNGALTLSTSQYQVLGLLNVAQISPAGLSKQRPALPVVVFTTTSNTTISAANVNPQASAWGVGVWQQIVSYDANSDPNNPDLYIQTTDMIVVNPEVYLPSVVDTTSSLVRFLNALTPWRHGPLTSPTTPLTDLDVPGDPDSPAVVGP